MNKGKKQPVISRKRLIAIVIMAALILFCVYKSKNRNDRKLETIETADNPEQVETYLPEADSQPAKTDADPYKLGFKTSGLLFASDLRKMLSRSELEYCSAVTEKENSNDVVLTWNLLDSGREVYRCHYTFDKSRKYAEQSVTACKTGEAYDEYLKGERRLSRDYIMPAKDDRIDMFVYENSSDYYEKYFILGRYSDMYCYIKEDDIYFEYYWYQNSDEGPILVYKSTAKNTTTTSGNRYRNDLWELFEESYLNIDIIPYDQFPREKDYYEVYRKWKRSDNDKKEEERLKEKIDLYCSFADGEDLYYEYQEEFDSYEDADYFYHEYCE